MVLKLTDLFKIESDEFLAVESSSKTPPQTLRKGWGNLPHRKPDINLLLNQLDALKMNQCELARNAGVKRWVVKDLVRGRFYKKSAQMKTLLRWLFNSEFRKAFEKNKTHICTCVHCGSKHRRKPLLQGE